MVESLVQWTLINNPVHLAEILDFEFSKIVGQEITTDYGRLDFVLENSTGKHLIVELETMLDNRSKLEYCFNQTINYKNVAFSPQTDYCILYASETKMQSKLKIETFCNKNGIIERTYSLENAKSLYNSTLKRLSLNVGLAFPNPKNYTICFLRWLNKIIKPFNDFQVTNLCFEEIFTPFQNPNNSRTNFNCYLRLAIDFELIEVQNENYVLTQNGILFAQNISPYAQTSSNVSAINLTNEQKRILLKILTNGNWEDKIHKVNIYWFLRFIEVTNGAWIPKSHSFDEDKLQIVRGLFNVSYNSRTMSEFLNWCSNYCLELGLTERMKSTSSYDSIFLTPLGIEVNNIFSLDLALKRNRMNLSFKYLE